MKKKGERNEGKVQREWEGREGEREGKGGRRERRAIKREEVGRERHRERRGSRIRPPALGRNNLSVSVKYDRLASRPSGSVIEPDSASPGHTTPHLDPNLSTYTWRHTSQSHRTAAVEAIRGRSLYVILVSSCIVQRKAILRSKTQVGSTPVEL
ncbi:hypothetical protein E2C01_053896 [Portunus trituberculatus]|uniref:Uncharacterized protein n=1 Tax=Portunus trituberculatus TaxID=210409 RepID=A0A5B7GS30_PORTR|nr:hypothetical protein [Portunus trituberculatus]